MDSTSDHQLNPDDEPTTIRLPDGGLIIRKAKFDQLRANRKPRTFRPPKRKVKYPSFFDTGRETDSDQKAQVRAINRMIKILDVYWAYLERIRAACLAGMKADATKENKESDETGTNHERTNNSNMTLADGGDMETERDGKVSEDNKKEKTSDEETTLTENRETNGKATNSKVIKLGLGYATVPASVFNRINWNSHTNATRKLLTAVFSRKDLATHNLTGRPSPAFPDKPVKRKLDPLLVEDIIQTVCDRCNVSERIVRSCITIKCADESKMLRLRQQGRKKRRLSETEKMLSHVASSPEQEF